MTPAPTIHASAVLVGRLAALIRGASGAGKSSLALHLLATRRDTRLVGDDRVHVWSAHGRLLVRPADALRGLIERRGVGIEARPFEPLARVGLVVDLMAEDAVRLPEPQTLTVRLDGILLPRIAITAGAPLDLSASAMAAALENIAAPR